MWFKKKELLPDLPGNDELPKLPKIEDRVFNDDLPNLKIKSLPSFLDDVDEKQTIKQEVNEIQKSNFDIPKQIKYPMEPEPNLDEVNIYSKTNSNIKPSVKSTEPVYIRLDKFQTTQVVIEEIKEKIFDIEKTLAKIKEIKEREEKELEEWEGEIKIMKSRIDNVDNSIFNKLR